MGEISPATQAKIDSLTAELEAAQAQAAKEQAFDPSALAGELPAGTPGFIILGEDGSPSGSAQVAPPDIGTPAARVITVQAITPESLVTPTGAPITMVMNPQPDWRDPAFLERNPPVMEPKTEAQAA